MLSNVRVMGTVLPMPPPSGDAVFIATEVLCVVSTAATVGAAAAGGAAVSCACRAT